jgi:prenyltransferase beta subunit
MKGGKINMKDKTNAILGVLFQENIDTFKDEEARMRIIQFISELKGEDEKFDKLNYSLFVQDNHKGKWQSKALFYKVF